MTAVTAPGVLPRTVFDAIDATWAPFARRRIGHWTIREGRGGGSRVSAASLNDPEVTKPDIAAAEAAMRALGQPELFMIRPGEEALDADLQARGYEMFAPVRILSAATSALSAGSELGRSVIDCQTILAIQKRIWAQGGIGPDRIAVMDRVARPKTALLARRGNDPTGVVFVATDGKLGLLHALEVPEGARRQGTGQALTAAAAHWCQMQGADHLVLLVTRDNTPANRMYETMGLQEITSYHYRTRKE